MEERKLSFKISWIDEEEVFLVKELFDGVVTEEKKLHWQSDVMDYIAEEMAMCQTWQEEWTFSY